MSKIFNYLSSTLYAMSELVEEEVCDACLFSCRAIWTSCHSSSVRFSGRELSAGGAEFSLAGEADSRQLSKLLILAFFDVSDSDTSFFLLFFPAKHWPHQKAYWYLLANFFCFFGGASRGGCLLLRFFCFNLLE